MNTLDFRPFEYQGEESFEEIFNLQKIVFDKYMEFEKNKIVDFDINCYVDQQIIKDFLQIRFVEELNEATMDFSSYSHLEEEMTDAFNFLVEAYLIYGWSYKDFPNTWLDYQGEKEQGYLIRAQDDSVQFIYGPESIDKTYSAFYKVIEQVGRACNLLKNRPWKQTQFLVDLMSFEKEFRMIWLRFSWLCAMVGIRKKRLFELWSLKYQVNLYRIETKY